MKANNTYKKISSFQKLSLSKQLVWTAILIAFISVLLTSYFVGVFYWSSYTSLLIENQNVKLNLGVNDLNNWISNHLDVLRLAAQSSTNDNSSTEIYTKIYGDLLRKHNAIQSISLYDKDRSCFVSVGGVDSTYLDSDTIESALVNSKHNKAEYIGKVSFLGDVPLLNVVIPILDSEGEVEKLLHSVINLCYMAVSIKAIPYEQYGYAYVLDERNNILASNFGHPSAQGKSPEHHDYFFFLKNASPQNHRGIDNKLVISSFREVKAAQWFLVVEYPISSLLSKLWKNLLMMFIAMVSAVLLGVIGIRIIYHNITNPLKDLIDAAEEISNGSWGTQLDVESDNELGKLSVAFNTMSEHVSKSLVDIQHQLIYERLTAEISSLYIQMELTDFSQLQAHSCELIGDFTKASTILQYFKDTEQDCYNLTTHWNSSTMESILIEAPCILKQKDSPCLFYSMFRNAMFCLCSKQKEMSIGSILNIANPTETWMRGNVSECEVFKWFLKEENRCMIALPFLEKESLFGFQIFIFNDGDMELNESNRLKLTNLSTLIGTSILKAYRGKKLQETSEKLSITLKSIDDAVLVVNNDDVVTLANPVAMSLLGLSEWEMIWSKLDSVLRFVTENKIDINRPAIEYLEEKSHRNTKYILTKEGVSIPIDVTFSSLRDGNGDHLGHVVVFKDISDRLRAESERIKMARHEALGYLAAGMAHDFNNLLCTVMGSIGVAKLSVSENPKAIRILNETEAFLMQGRAIAEQLFALDKNADRVEGCSFVQTILKNVAHMALYNTNVEAIYEVQEDLPPVKLADGTVNQILANLVINAAQAMPEGGKLVLKAATTVISSNTDLPLNPGSYIRVNIVDNGTGMDANTLENVFLPYFTTKEHGSGLGIPTVFSLITRYGGYFRLKSVLGEGTDSELFFPVA